MSPEAASSVTIQRCNPAAADEPLALVAQVWPEVERAAQVGAIRAALREAHCENVLFLEARQNGNGGRLVGAVLGQVMPGNVALVTPPQLQWSFANGGPELSVQLLDRLHDELRNQGVELAQASLAADDVNSAADLRSAGYEHAADLLYMAAEVDTFPELPPKMPFELLLADAADAARLARVVDATYQGTLDCPRIDGLRSTADVLTSYRSVGKLRPDLWQIARANNEDVGCLLLADHAESRQYEIVYLALTPGVRGRGWGIELTRHAQWLARRAGYERLVLAVDAANEPAIRMYAAAGFQAWDRRAVWIKSLRA